MLLLAPYGRSAAIKACKSNDPNDWTQFEKLLNIVNSEIRLAKQAYYQNSFNQYTGDSRKTWQTINELASSKSGKTAVTSLKVNGVSITNPTELSNEFNNHFATIGPELSRNIDSPDGDVYQRYITSTDQCFQLRPTTVNKVFSLLNKLNKSKATGLHKISAPGMCRSHLHPYLRYFSNRGTEMTLTAIA